MDTPTSNTVTIDAEAIVKRRLDEMNVDQYPSAARQRLVARTVTWLKTVEAKAAAEIKHDDVVEAFSEATATTKRRVPKAAPTTARPATPGASAAKAQPVGAGRS
jgi:hypothetical protein